jgi:hypothetical protein
VNALQLIQEACSIVGIARPNSIIGSSDTGVRQLLGLFNKEGRELSARHAWEALIREATFNSVALEDQGALSTIIGAVNSYRYIVNDTLWNRDRKEPICGPQSSMDWQALKTLDLSGPYTEYRIRGGHLLFLPAPAAGEEIAFEYVTQNWCTSADGSEQRRSIADDEDIVLLSDEIMLAGVEWRWQRAKRLSYAEEFTAYERLVADAKARDGTQKRLSLAGRGGSGERRMAVPPGSWNL